MKNIAIELKVGASVLIAVAILFFSILWLKEYRFDIQRYEYAVLFPNVGTLEVGDPVKVLGVKKGDVREIEISGNYVLVTFALTDDIILKKDSRFRVMNIGLMGERFIDVTPGESSERLDLAVPVHGQYDTGMPEVMGMAGQAIEELRRLVAIFEGSFGTPAMTETMRGIITDLGKAAADWRNLTEQNKAKMSEAIDDLAAASSGLREFMETNNEKMALAAEDVSAGAERFTAAMARLDSLSAIAHTLLTNMSDGEGTIGRAMTDDELYTRLLATTDHLDSLIADIKRNPRRYVKLSIF